MSLWCLLPWFNHLTPPPPPRCWFIFWNSSLNWHHVEQQFSLFSILIAHIMIILYLYLPYAHVSNNALCFVKYSCTLLLHRRSLYAFYGKRQCYWWKVENAFFDFTRIINCLVIVGETYRFHNGNQEMTCRILSGFRFAIFFLHVRNL